MFSLGLNEHHKREEDMNSFFTSIGEAREENKKQGVTFIQEYSEYKKKVQYQTSMLTLSHPEALLWQVKSSGVRQSKITKWPL